MSVQEFENLTGKLLIATPFSMKGLIYHQSLIYMMHHSDNGSIGFIFNHEIDEVPAEEVFKEYDITKINELKINVHIGGPANIKNGFFLHSSDYCKDVLMHDHYSDLCISSNYEILDDISKNKGPDKTIFMIGYTTWTKGQLEEELQNNLWIVSQPTHDLIFDSSIKDKWSSALRHAGVSENSFSPLCARS